MRAFDESGSAGLTDYEYGVSGAGVVDLIDNVKLHALEEAAATAVAEEGAKGGGKKVIKDVAKEYWTGQSEAQFEAMLDDDANTYATNVTNLVNAAIKEITNSGQEYKVFDEHLMDNIQLNSGGTSGN